MDIRNNNIFQFATKELSQDAVICWILNWANYPQEELYELGCDFLNIINEKPLTPGQKIKIYQQKKHADIAIVIPSQKRIIIIEDKVYSSEHDNQIETYKKEYEDLNTQKNVLGIETEEPYTVSTIYLKTGFFYDEDKLVKADHSINWEMFYGIVSNPKYKGKSEVLDSFVQRLLGIHSNYAKCHIDDKYEDGETYSLSWEHYPQYQLMRYIFPEEMWNKAPNAYKVTSGSSSGRPWTEMDISEPYSFRNSNDKYELFWRIDSAGNDPYLSFRLYEGFDKEDEKRKTRHREYYSLLLDITKSAVEEMDAPLKLSWDDVKVRYSGNYKESALFTIELKDYLKKWDEKKDLFAEYVRNITNDIVKRVENGREEGLL